MDLEGGRQAIHTETKKQEINTFLCSYGVELLNLIQGQYHVRK